WVAARLRVHFVGTGTSPDDRQGFRVLPRAQAAGVTEMVHEHPHRIGYVDTLNHLEQSGAVLVIGSTERHYTRSKVLQGRMFSHPIQYYTPIFRELAKRCDLTVYFAHRQSAEQQASAGFGVSFDWDIDLLSGYRSHFLTNVSRRPSTGHFWGCNTPDIFREVANGGFDAFVVPGWFLWT